MKRSIRRSFHIAGWLVISLFMAISCAGVGTKPAQDEQDPQVLEFKRGRLKGPQYFNEYYKFQITTPRGWRAIRPKTDFVLRMSPQADNVLLEIAMSDLKTSDTLEILVKKIIKSGDYEVISEMSDTFRDEPAYRCELRKGMMLSKALYILTGEALIEIYSRAPAEEFATYQISFDEAVSSIRFTDKFIEGLGQEDYFPYLVESDDTLKSLALLFLNDSSQETTIAYFNQLTNLIPNRSIDIPRFVTYTVQEGDTAESISKAKYNDPGRFPLIASYNPNLDEQDLLTPGTMLKIPMYFSYEIGQADTLAKLAKEYLASENRAELIYIYNGKAPIKTGAVIKIPILWAAPNYIMYTVKPNDSLASIAQTMTGDVNNYPKIAEFNNIRPPFELAIGQQLKIPADLYNETPVKKPPSRKKPPKKAEEEKIEEEIEGPIYEPD